MSYIQSAFASDGVEVRAVGPKAVTLALPPELHDLGNMCGELELRYNARVDIAAHETPGVGPTATVWVQGSDGERADAASQNQSEDSSPAAAPSEDAAPHETLAEPAHVKKRWFVWNKCTAGAVVAALTVSAACLSIVSNGTSLWKHLEL